MTTGTKIDDQTVLMSTSCGQVRVGYKYEKTWNGANRFNILDDSPHPYEMDLRISRDTLIDWRFAADPPTTHRTGTVDGCFGGPRFSSGWTTNTDLALVSKLSDKVRGSQFNLGNTVAEMKGSLTTIATTATRVAKALSYLHKGRFDLVPYALGLGSVKRTVATDGRGRSLISIPVKHPSVDQMTKVWLEYRYAWRPMLHDVREGALALATTLNREYTETFRARLKLVLEPTNTAVKFIGYKIEQGQIAASITHFADTKQTEFGIQDPFTTAWEVLPYSFVIDWFIPVSNFLSACSTFRHLTAEYVTTRTTKVEIRGCSDGENYKVQDNGYHLRTVSMRRTVGGSLQIPLPQLKPLSSVPSFLRAVDAVALLLNARSKGISINRLHS